MIEPLFTATLPDLFHQVRAKYPLGSLPREAVEAASDITDEYETTVETANVDGYNEGREFTLDTLSVCSKETADSLIALLEDNELTVDDIDTALELLVEHVARAT
jgi:hypothetical protein